MMIGKDFEYKYCPILSISPAEMMAYKELPGKDKDKILPIFPLKSWVSSRKLESSIERIRYSVGNERYWIADIDLNELSLKDESKYREVHHELKSLTIPDNGYRNWCDFIEDNKYAIPCLQLGDVNQLSTQVDVFDSLGRGIVAIIRDIDFKNNILNSLVPVLNDKEGVLVIVDFEQITDEHVKSHQKIQDLLEEIKKLLPRAHLSISGTSFPDSFGGYYRGCKSIHERSLYDRVRLKMPGLIYSDRGGARAEKQSGGAGTPPPRIDYACRNEWHFIRRELPRHIKDKEQKKAEKRLLYTEIAMEIMNQAYWEEGLALYSNYLIELTSKGDDFGIDSAQKATAVRINKHLHTQLYYDDIENAQDTDDEWVD